MWGTLCGRQVRTSTTATPPPYNTYVGIRRCLAWGSTKSNVPESGRRKRIERHVHAIDATKWSIPFVCGSSGSFCSSFCSSCSSSCLSCLSCLSPPWPLPPSSSSTVACVVDHARSNTRRSKTCPNTVGFHSIAWMRWTRKKHLKTQ